jgi:hypothetical protein
VLADPLQRSRVKVNQSEPGVYLAYASDRSGDGLGAQAQRLMGIYSAAKHLGFGYVHNPIESIEPNPGDPPSTTEERENFLERVNQLFWLPDSSAISPRKHLNLPNLHKKSVQRLHLLNHIARSTKLAIQVNLSHSLPWSDEFPDSYGLASQVIQPRLPLPGVQDKTRVDMHIRRALAPQYGRSGEPYDRYVSTEWYVQVARFISAMFREQGIEPFFRIHTDIPLQRWRVPEDVSPGTRGMWRHHNLIDDHGYLIDLSEDLDRSFTQFGAYEIAREWNAIAVLESMVTADILVTCASSLSYVAGLLRLGKPNISPVFFHKAPTTWCSLDHELGIADFEMLQNYLTSSDWAHGSAGVGEVSDQIS